MEILVPWLWMRCPPPREVAAWKAPALPLLQRGSVLMRWRRRSRRVPPSHGVAQSRRHLWISVLLACKPLDQEMRSRFAWRSFRHSRCKASRVCPALYRFVMMAMRLKVLRSSRSLLWCTPGRCRCTACRAASSGRRTACRAASAPLLRFLHLRRSLCHHRLRL